MRCSTASADTLKKMGTKANINLTLIVISLYLHSAPASAFAKITVNGPVKLFHLVASGMTSPNIMAGRIASIHYALTPLNA